jgi:hypothetical protein
MLSQVVEEAHGVATGRHMHELREQKDTASAHSPALESVATSVSDAIRQAPGAGSAGFTLFAVSWGIAGIFHQVSFVDWRWTSVEGQLLTAALLWFLLKPSSWKRFALLLAIDSAAVARNFPVHPNHIVFAWVVNLTLLTALLVARREHRTAGDLGSAWYSRFAPWLRIELTVLYLFSAFHKLNWSFLNVERSCAAVMQQQIASWFPLMPDAVWAQYAAIYGTLLIEASLPFMLFHRRTRTAGAVLGMLFHGVLALYAFSGLFSFSTTMAALYSVFIPEDVAARIVAPQWLRRLWPWGIGAFALLGVFWLARHALPSGLRVEERWSFITRAGLLVYYVYLCGALALFGLALREGRARMRESLPGAWRSAPVLAIFPLVLCVNCIGPYFGLRTQSSLSMFSNLQTEAGVSNHLLMPSSFHLTDWQQDLVDIVDSNNAELRMVRDNGQRLPYLDLTRMRGSSPNLSVTFRRNGKLTTFDETRSETLDALPRAGWLARRYFFFRPVDPDPLRVLCKH